MKACRKWLCYHVHPVLVAPQPNNRTEAHNFQVFLSKAEEGFWTLTSGDVMLLQSQSAPWPEVPLSPKTPQTPMLSKHGTWHTLDIRGASCSVSIPEDESVHSEGGQSASYRTPVRLPVLCCKLNNRTVAHNGCQSGYRDIFCELSSSVKRCRSGSMASRRSPI